MTVSLVARQHGVAASHCSCGVSNINNCLEGKNYGATLVVRLIHSSFFLSIAFRMVSSLRIQATSATFFGLSGCKQAHINVYHRIKAGCHKRSHVQC